MKPKSALRSYLALAGSTLLAISYTHAATLYWDGATPSGAPTGGTGTWDTAGNWDLTQSADSSSNWVDGNIAYFGGTASTIANPVALGTNISVGGLRFDTTGYVINTGANTLSFGAGDNNILLNGNTAVDGTPVTATTTGAVGGTGNVIFSFGAIQAFPSFQNLRAQGVITLNGTSTTGWSGTTTVKQGMTLSLAGSNQGLLSTTGITLLGGTRNSGAGNLGGGITITNTTNGEAALDRVSSATITSHGGNITVTNTAAVVTSYNEIMGALDLRLGTLNVTQTNLLTTGTQTLTFGTDSLNNVNGVARTNATTSAITFSGTSLGANARNSIIITGQATTGVGQIIAPWATYGASAGVQTDYATYNITGGVGNAFGIQAANIAASAQTGWTTAANAYTANAGAAAGGSTGLAGTRTITALRSISGANTMTVDNVGNTFALTSNTFANGDAFILGGTAPTGLTSGNTYFVVNKSGDTFQLENTPGAGAIDFSTDGTSVTATGAITLSTGNNLETYGLLNGVSTTTHVVRTGTGVLTTPSGGGNLYLTTGNGSITVSAPITNASDSSAVTVVRNGAVDNGVLTFSGNNTFTGGLVLNTNGSGGSTRLVGTQSFTGGVILNGGLLGDSTTPLTAAALNNNAITVNGMAQIFAADTTAFTSSSSITINATGALDLGANGTVTVNGAVSGDGTLQLNHGNTNSGSTVILASTANTFTGNVVSSNYNGGARPLYVNSFGDGGKFTVGYNSANGSAVAKIFGLNSTATAPLTFNVRQFEMIGSAAGNLDNLALANNSGSAFTINTDLLVNALGTRTLTLQGTGTGLSTFGGAIGNGSLTGLAIQKTESGRWALSGTNTYSGTVTNNTLVANTALIDGTTIFQGLQALPNNSTLYTQDNSSANGSLRLLDDGGTLSRNVNILKATMNTSGAGTMNIFVGNNGTVNLGSNVSSTATGNTISMGSISYYTNNATNAAMTTNVTGANGYRLLINGINLNNRVTTGAAVSTANYTTTLNPTTAPLTLAGTITQLSGAIATSGNMTLALGGTATNNLVTGNIQNAADYPANANAQPLALTKTNLNDWTLSGANTYSGGTTITTGKLLFSGANALPTTGTVAVGAAGHLSLADGTARNQTVSALTLTSLGSLSFDWTGSGTGDQLTSTADITPTAASRFYVNLNRSGTPGGSVTLLTGGAGSTLSSSSFYLANATDFTATLATPTVDTLVVSGYTSQTPLTTIYWMGNKLAAGPVAGVDNSWAFSDGTKSNWSSTNTSYTATALTPGNTANVIFSNTLASRAQQSTVLGADLTVNSLVIDDATAVTIAGANGAALTLLSSLSTPGLVDGTPGSAITVTSNANATSTISSRVILGANQTWHVASGKTLAVSGIVGGDYSLTKASTGTLTLSALPEYTGTTTISAGALTFGGGLSGGASIIGRTSAITLSQGATLNFNTSTSGINNIYTAAAPITLSGGAGTASIRVGNNDVRLYVSGNVTGQSGVAQTLSISQGLQPNAATNQGDRQNILFSGVIANGGSGGTLGVSVDFAGSSGVAQNAFVNFSGQNTFTGHLTVANTKGINGPAGYTNQGAWLTIGGERYSPNGPIITNIGNGYLGGGNYSGNISVSSGAGKTTLSYFSTANQTLGGTISGTGALQMDGTNTLTLSGSNTFTGSTTINSGTLAVSNIDVVANNNALGKSSAAAANLILRGGTLQYITGGSASTDRNFALVSSSTIDASGAGALSFSQTGDISPDVTGLTFNAAGGAKLLTNLSSTANLVVGMSVTGTGIAAGSTIASIDSATQVTLASSANVTVGTGVSAAFGYGSRTLTLTGTNTGANTIAGNLVNSTAGSGVLSVAKTGAGTWVLSGTNTYTGATSINVGTLTITGATLNTTAITVGASGKLGLGILTPVTASAATVTLGGSVQVTGTPTLASYTLLTASSITGTPVLATPISGYTLQVSGNQLQLVQTGGGSPYDTWASSKGLTAGNKAKNLDPDNDGRNNLGEFAFNGNPLSGSDNGKVYVLTEDSLFDGDTTKELILTAAVRTGTLAFAGSPSPTANQAADGITYTIEGSLDLASFPTTVNVVSPVTTGLPVDPGAGYEYRSFSLSGSNGLTGKGFLRAKVTSP